MKKQQIHRKSTYNDILNIPELKKNKVSVLNSIYSDGEKKKTQKKNIRDYFGFHQVKKVHLL